MSRLFLIIIFLFTACANFRTLTYKDPPGKFPFNSEKATICILRPPNQIGGNYIIHDGENKIGILSAASYFTLELQPGKHVFFYSDAWKVSKEKFEIVLEKAKTYYIVLNQVKVGSFANPQNIDTPVYGGRFVLAKEQDVKSFFPDMNEVDLEASYQLFQ